VTIDLHYMTDKNGLT